VRVDCYPFLESAEADFVPLLGAVLTAGPPRCQSSWRTISRLATARSRPPPT